MSKTRMCRYECGTELGDFDEKQNKYLEVNGTLHTRERCQSLKTQTGTKKVEIQSQPQSKQPLTIDQIDSRLRRVEKVLFSQGT